MSGSVYKNTNHSALNNSVEQDHEFKQSHLDMHCSLIKLIFNSHLSNRIYLGFIAGF